MISFSKRGGCQFFLPGGSLTPLNFSLLCIYLEVQKQAIQLILHSYTVKTTQGQNVEASPFQSALVEDGAEIIEHSL